MSQEPPPMSSHLRTPRAAAVAGIVFSVLLVIIFWGFRSAVPADPLDSGTWLVGGSGHVALALNLIPFAGIAFLWFIGVLRDRLGSEEDRFFATAFLGSGLLFLAILFLAATIVGALLLIAPSTELTGTGASPTYVRMGTSSNFGNMLSMAFASLFLPFLPLTPIQVLLNNLLYDLSETGIPFDNVDERETARPHTWDMHEVLRFCLIMGPLSSVFDIATFIVLVRGFAASAEVFRTAWFVEPMATQILVVFLIRTALPAWVSRPNPVLVASSLATLGAAIVIALAPAGRGLGFEGLSWPILAIMTSLVAGYLLAAEVMKRLALGKRRMTTRPPATG